MTEPQRINTLTDGVFAIAMTFLVLDVMDAAEGVDTHAQIWPTLWPKLASYIMGFLILGLLWNGHYIAASYVKRSDRTHLWLSINFLIWAALVPYPAGLLSEYYTDSLAVLIYGGNLTLAAGSLYAVWAYATKDHHLVDKDLPQQTVTALKRRLLLAMLGYLLAMAVALWQPVAGLLVFVASHLYFALTPVTEDERST